MKHLNKYQLTVLNKGAEEENNGIHINFYPEKETNELLSKYQKYIENKWDESDEFEIIVYALLDLFDFWACYFACGSQCAFGIHDEGREALLEELRNRKRYIDDEEFLDEKN